MKGNSIRMIESASRRMQRVGFLKYFVSRASQMGTSSLQTLGDDLLKTVSKRVLVSVTPELAEYLRVTLKEQSDKSLLGKVKEAMELCETEKAVSVQLQDAYLSSRQLPSRRGRLVSNDWRNYPHLAIGLGLLRKDSFAPLVRGHVLLELVSSDELNAFRDYSENTNPLMLTLEQKIFFIFTFVEHDEHLLLPLYRALLLRGGEFADWEAGDLLPGIMREIYRRVRPSVHSGADTLRLQRLVDTAKAIEQWHGKPYSGKGVRDEAATIRLEPFVDLGVLAKKNPFSYRYEFTPAGRHLMSELSNGGEGASDLESNFFSKVTAAFGFAATHISKPDEILEFIYRSFRSLASPLGYAPIREVLLLAGISAIGSRSGYFEIAEALEALRALRQQHPELVRFNVDRWGNLTFVKFTRSPVITSSE